MAAGVKKCQPEGWHDYFTRTGLSLTFDLFTTVERRLLTQRFFDTNQLVVFSNAVRTAP